ncbi:hypothetical protein CGC21_18690 [Leishmania donovani]|uniref:Protein kinase domain-containing protein n=1 Tax=Leishmania donovani TaxID=5661 RepID=A0A504X4Y4_LEIDO|nr:hypothetical protein CGC21_18690 [Leishmania donovani]
MTSYGIDGEVEQRYRISATSAAAPTESSGVLSTAARASRCPQKGLRRLCNVQDAQRTYREVMLLQRLRHNPFIVGILDVIRAANDIDLYLVFELIETDLTAIIPATAPSSSGLWSGSHVRSGFDNEQEFLDLTDYIATRWYRRRRFWSSRARTPQRWTCGHRCVIGEMLLGHPLFEGRNTLDQLRLIVEAIGVPSDADVRSLHSPELETLINSLPTPLIFSPLPGELEKIQDLDPLVLPLVDEKVYTKEEYKANLYDEIGMRYRHHITDVY